MFLKKKSKKSNLRFFKKISTFFSSKKNKKFTFYFKKKSGISNTGHISTRHRQNLKKTLDININKNFQNFGLKYILLKIIWWKKNKPFLGLFTNLNNCLSYFILPHGFFYKKRFKFQISPFKKKNKIFLGNIVFLKHCKINKILFNIMNSNFISLKIAISAGTFYKLLYLSNSKLFFVLIIPSGKKIKIKYNWMCVVGKNSNILNKKKIIGGAGFKKKLGFRSSVRGVAMNPVDHPHGGRTKTNKPEKSPWGWIAKKSK